MSEELLPCPFCGKAPRLCDMGGWEIFCECGADMCLHVETPEPEPLIAAWNTRATQPQAPQGGVTVTVPRSLALRTWSFLAQDCSPCSVRDCQIEGMNAGVDVLVAEWFAATKEPK